MKHCKKAVREPPSLEDFRTGHPNATWDHLRNEAGTYRAILDALSSDQSGLCAYCELLLTAEHSQVAHFHPKSDTTHNWALDWKNLWLACKGGTQTSHVSDPSHYLPPLPANISCDEKKRDQILDGTVLTPNDVPTFPRIFRFQQRLDGMDIVPDEAGCQQAGILLKKAQETIDQFNLNCQRLSSARLKCYQPIEHTIAKLRQSNLSNPHAQLASLAKKHLAKNPDGHWPTFFTLIRWRFKETAETYLQAISYQG